MPKGLTESDYKLIQALIESALNRYRPQKGMAVVISDLEKLEKKIKKLL